jgi:Uma2 family endonuclease
MSQTVSPPEPKPLAGYDTFADLMDALGDVPPERVLLHPLPGTARAEDVVELDDHQDRLCELIDGVLVEKAMGFDESEVGSNILAFIKTFVRSRKLGHVAGEAGLVRTSDRRVRIPDVSFTSYSRFPAGKKPRGAFLELAPDLVVEVYSPKNTKKEMLRKREELFKGGTQLFWIVYLPARTIDVYTSPETYTTLTIADTLTGGDVLPGFAVPVADIFADLDD